MIPPSGRLCCPYLVCFVGPPRSPAVRICKLRYCCVYDLPVFSSSSFSPCRPRALPWLHFAYLHVGCRIDELSRIYTIVMYLYLSKKS
ncbi:hypothetical protein FKP32DRAFT_1240114 [Trametes sanguinea]|nr:hypothetical protein FKP32DRAFT_1240114 [Trametes sanguinea]